MQFCCEAEAIAMEHSIAVLVKQHKPSETILLPQTTAESTPFAGRVWSNNLGSSVAEYWQLLWACSQ